MSAYPTEEDYNLNYDIAAESESTYTASPSPDEKQWCRPADLRWFFDSRCNKRRRRCLMFSIKPNSVIRTWMYFGVLEVQILIAF